MAPDRPGEERPVPWSTGAYPRSSRSRSVRDLFVSTPGALATSPDLAWFRSLRTSTTSVGIRVHALGAEVWWLDGHAAALAWQRQALATGLFDGAHLDVEPWLHPSWSQGSSALLASWVGLLGELSAADTMTVMSYRDTATGPDSITGISATALATAARLGRSIRLAVETRYLGPDAVSAKQTFHGSSARQLDRALTEVAAAVAGHPTYAGIAVHDHVGGSALRS